MVKPGKASAHERVGHPPEPLWYLPCASLWLDNGRERNKVIFCSGSVGQGHQGGRGGINIVVRAGDKKVYFYNSNGVIGKPMKLKDFMGQ
jgi:hypothetical protein